MLYNVGSSIGNRGLLFVLKKLLFRDIHGNVLVHRKKILHLRILFVYFLMRRGFVRRDSNAFSLTFSSGAVPPMSPRSKKVRSSRLIKYCIAFALSIPCNKYRYASFYILCSVCKQNGIFKYQTAHHHSC